MDRDDIFLLGTLVKTHGKKGDFLVKFNVDHPEDFEDMESVFILIDEQPVPFFIPEEGLRFTSPTSAIISFDDIDNEDKAREFAGCDLYLPIGMSNDNKRNFQLSDLEGFAVSDRKSGKVGIVNQVLTFPNNVVLQVMKGKTEILIPFTEELIVDLDFEKARIEMDLPEGLLDLYQ